jgi:hypothetical protein
MALRDFTFLKKRGYYYYILRRQKEEEEEEFLWKLKIYFSMQKYAKYIYTYLKKAKI